MTDSSSKIQDKRPGSVMDQNGNHEENCDLVQLEKLSLDETISPQKAQCSEDSEIEPPQGLHIMQKCSNAPGSLKTLSLSWVSLSSSKVSRFSQRFRMH